MQCVKGMIVGSLMVLLARPVSLHAQEFEIQQLLLNVEKLAHFKVILQNMYKGYKILHEGYTGIKNISEGNFNIHHTFLDGLLSVSPSVRKYKRVADIIQYQLLIVREGKAAYHQFRQDKSFTAVEIEYMGRVYRDLADQSLKNLDDLMTVITAGKLRMSDDERITSIDRIYSDVVDDWAFLKHFNNTTKLLSMARVRELQDIDVGRQISGVK